MPAERPEEIHHRFAAAANAGDAAALAALYEPEALIVERDGSFATGAAAIRSHLDDLVSMRPQMEILDSKAFRNGDTALLCSRWNATVTPPGGAEVTMESRGSEVARRQDDGTWLLLLDNPWGTEVCPRCRTNVPNRRLHG